MATAATDRPAAQLLLFATDRPRRHRPPHNARAKTPPPQTAPERTARGLLIGKNAAATDRPAAQLLLFTTDRPRRHRPPRSATTAPQRARLADWQPPPQTAPQRNYFFLPQTAPAATDRPAAQLLPHNARGLLIGNRRHRPPRSATTSFCHRPPPPPQTTDRPTTRAQKRRRHRPPRNAQRGARLADWQRRRRHRPPRSATTSFYHRPPAPPQIAPQRARKNTAQPSPQ